MAKGLEVKVPEEIMDYKESLIAGLSVRQLACGAVALGMGIPTFFILKGISMDLATYATMVVVMPAFLVGFIKKDGYNFETYVKIHFYSFFGKSKKNYEIELYEGLPIETEEFRALAQDEMRKKEEAEAEDHNVVKKSEKQKATNRRRKQTQTTEYYLVEVTKKSLERKRKATSKAIKAKTKRVREEKYEKKKKIKSRGSSKKLPKDVEI